MKHYPGSVSYSGMAPTKIASLIVGMDRFDTGVHGVYRLKICSSLPPDLVELRLISDSFQTDVRLRCLFLPVDSATGAACEIAYKYIIDQSPITEQQEAAAKEVANKLIYLIDRVLRQNGARRTTRRKFFTVEGDNYIGATVEIAQSAILQIISLHQELRDANNKLLVSWYGSLVWSSARTGMIAAYLHYRDSQNCTQKIFMRLHVFWINRKNLEISVAYDCSSNKGLDDRKSLAWEIIRELIRQTSERICSTGAERLASSIGAQRAQRTDITSTDEQAGYETVIPVTTPEFTRSVYWPSLQDYNEAMQNSQMTLGDKELRAGKLQLQQFGLPYVVSGAFACVYKITCANTDYAIRCFSTPVHDQSERYRRMSNFICSDNLPYTMDFHFMEKGILLNGQWFPLVKMEWIHGESLTSLISSNINNPEALTTFRRKLWLMLLELEREGVAHGDLQHGNIIIKDNEFVLVDYDGMYVPNLQGYLSREKGHPNYQHPGRNEQHFGPYLDNFSAWLIDTALLAIIQDKTLWFNFHEGDECLLFRHADLVNPFTSKIFAALDGHQCLELNRRSEYLRRLLAAPVESIPPLGPGYPELIESSQRRRSDMLPDWM